MRQAPPELEQRLRRIAIQPILFHGVLDRLALEWILEFRREQGQPVQEDRRVQALFVLRAVFELADDGELVAEIKFLRRIIEPGRRFEIRQPEFAAVRLDALAQDVERAVFVNLRGQALQQHRLGIGRVLGSHLLPLLGLRGVDEIQHVLRDQAEFPVIVGGFTPAEAPRQISARGSIGQRRHLLRPAAQRIPQQARLNARFKVLLGRVHKSFPLPFGVHALAGPGLTA